MIYWDVILDMQYSHVFLCFENLFSGMLFAHYFFYCYSHGWMGIIGIKLAINSHYKKSKSLTNTWVEMLFFGILFIGIPFQGMQPTHLRGGI